jgi:hypothetical protein
MLKKKYADTVVNNRYEPINVDMSLLYSKAKTKTWVHIETWKASIKYQQFNWICLSPKKTNCQPQFMIMRMSFQKL